tara:strand:- start:1352 stop:2074 length:723 start_codon:yes stop_codon:yes gene_type:complete
MIQAITETNFTAYVQTEDNRIDTSVASTKVRHLVKFTNDMDKSVVYSYGTHVVPNIFNRYTRFPFVYSANPNIYDGTIKLLPAGYWKYEVYEVVWLGTVTIALGNAPATENDTLSPAATDKGIVKGLVTKGKMYVAEKDGTEQVQYTQNAHSVIKLNIVNGGTGYTQAPIIAIQAGSISTATATCTIDGGGSVNSVTIVDSGAGYTEIPIVTIIPFGGGAGSEASITAEIEQTNYIWYGQ